ncbi:hypothetical protein [Methanothrix soehngenii]|uniref:hypothetical protein n=1 Tax=Methanothrix soehngenii TaxID=2223 RepID=UPI00300C80B6
MALVMTTHLLASRDEAGTIQPETIDRFDTFRARGVAMARCRPNAQVDGPGGV